MKKALITGVCGQDGSYLAELLLSKGYEVHGMMRRSSNFNTSRIDHLYKDPNRFPDTEFLLHFGDLTDSSSIRHLLDKIRPDEIYNLGAQSHVAVSFQLPEYTVDTVALGALRLFDAARDICPKAKIYQAGSSEMFGDSGAPQTEFTPFSPLSPYACAKVFAHNAAINYRKAYGMFISNGILFNHECLTANTPVIYKRNGFIDIAPIEELVPHRESPNHKKYTSKINFEIWDGDRWTEAILGTATWNDGGSKSDKKVINVNCRGAYYEATEDHVSFKDGFLETKTGSLKSGDFLELKSLPQILNNSFITEEEAEFLGMMVGDGFVKGSCSRFTNSDEKLINRADVLWRGISNGKTLRKQYKGGYENSGMVWQLSLSGNRDLLRKYRTEIYTEKGYKKVPVRILNSNIKIQTAFLRGYNVCDGLMAGHQKSEFKSWTTNSPILAQGLFFIGTSLGYRITLHPEQRDSLYFHLNINSNSNNNKGKHLRKPIKEIKSLTRQNYTGWLFDLETHSGTFSAGIGFGWVHNSPRRTETFVTRKITRAATRIKLGLQDKLYLGNLDAKRDWGFAGDYVEAMYLMLQKDYPDDYVIATGKSYSVRFWLDLVFSILELDYKNYVVQSDRYFRPSDVEELCGNSFKAGLELEWFPKIHLNALAHMMVESDLSLAKKELL